MTTEIHGNFKPFFHPDSTLLQKDKAAQTLVTRFINVLAEEGIP